MKNNLAIIFDMDGVIVNNTKYHILAWQKFAKSFGINVSKQTVKTKFMGKHGKEIIKDLLPNKHKTLNVEKIDLEREAYYRKIYGLVIKPVLGLRTFLKHLNESNIKVALATSAPPQNVKFTLRKTALTKFFPVIVDSKGVKKGKPSPDVFLKAARLLKIAPTRCIVFEDTLNGIEAAKRANMKVIGVATSHKRSEIKHADLVIKNFNNLTIFKIKKLIL